MLRGWIPNISHLSGRNALFVIHRPAARKLGGGNRRNPGVSVAVGMRTPLVARDIQRRRCHTDGPIRHRANVDRTYMGQNPVRGFHTRLRPVPDIHSRRQGGRSRSRQEHPLLRRCSLQGRWICIRRAGPRHETPSAYGSARASLRARTRCHHARREGIDFDCVATQDGTSSGERGDCQFACRRRHKDNGDAQGTRVGREIGSRHQ